VVLEPVPVDAMPDLPLVIGPRANRQTYALDDLITAAPHLKPQLASATWVGGRRWTCGSSRASSGAPGRRETAQRALTKFARMDKMTQLLVAASFASTCVSPASSSFACPASRQHRPPAPKPEPAPAPVQTDPSDPRTVI
jgi:cell division protein FtsQ